MTQKKDLKIELTNFMHEMVHINNVIFETGDYNNLLVLCEQDISILACVSKYKEVTAKSICEELGAPKTTIVSAVTRLKEKGYLVKIQNEKDKRENFLKLTQKGQKANIEHEEYENRILEYLCNMWNEDEQKKLAELLKNRKKAKEAS